MSTIGTLYLYRSAKTKGLFCFSALSKSEGLPPSLAPWRRFGQVRTNEALPHGLERDAIAPGIREHGYQLYLEKPLRSRGP